MKRSIKFERYVVIQQHTGDNFIGKKERVFSSVIEEKKILLIQKKNGGFTPVMIVDHLIYIGGIPHLCK